jgi:hypothetical protein
MTVRFHRDKDGKVVAFDSGPQHQIHAEQPLMGVDLFGESGKGSVRRGDIKTSLR